MQKIIKYRIVGDNDFVRDIEIREDSTFMDFHKAIQKACNFDPSLMTTFYTADENWEAQTEIIFERLDEKTQQDCYLMDETLLNYVKPEKGQRFIYLFDFFSVRSFLIEIVNIRNYTKKDEKLDYPICTFEHGEPPEQVIVEDLDLDDDNNDKDNWDDENKFYDDEYEDEYDDEYGSGEYSDEINCY